MDNGQLTVDNEMQPALGNRGEACMSPAAKQLAGQILAECCLCLTVLAQDAHANAVAHDFYRNPPSFGDQIALVHSELSEALEVYRDGLPLPMVTFEHGKPCGAPIELADALIRILDMCAFHKIDIGSAVKVKMNYNLGRPLMHGGKIL